MAIKMIDVKVLERMNRLAQRFGLPNMKGSIDLNEHGEEVCYNLSFEQNVQKNAYSDSFPKKLKELFGIKKLVFNGGVY